MQLPKTADIIVIGAGVIGSSISMQLAMRQAGRIVVMDRGYVGQGMSARSSAVVRMHYAFRPEVELAVLSLRLFEEWPEVVGAPALLRKTGFVRFVTPTDSERLRANVAMQQACGVDVRLVEGSAVRHLLPGWCLDDVAEVAYEPGGGYGDGSRAASDMLARSVELGVEYFPEVIAERLRIRSDQVAGVDTSAGTISAPLVVCAVGPWTQPLLSAVGFEVPIANELHEVTLVRVEAPALQVRLACIDAASRTYFRPDGENLFLIGTLDGCGQVSPDDFPQQPSLESLAASVEAAAQRLPALGSGGIIRGYTGVYDMTPDGRPVLGFIPGIGGLCLAAGFSGTGFKLSPGIGVVLAELIVAGRATTVDISPFRPDRFARGEAIRAPHEYQDSRW